jgi:hypothetical protein
MRPLPVVLSIAAVLAVTGCRAGGGDDLARNAEPVGPQVKVGEGEVPSGPWTASLYRQRNGLTCLMVREADGTSSGGCDGAAAVGPTVSGNGAKTTTVTGGTSRPEATSARVTLTDGRQFTLDLIQPAAGVTKGVRYYVGVFLGTEVAQTVEIMGSGGQIFDSYDVGP